MAIGSTLYIFEVSLSDTEKDVYENLSVRAAQHSSESIEYLICRVLAYCLEYEPGLEFTKGLDDPSLPAIWTRDLTGLVTKCIEIGCPSADKLNKASKSCPLVRIYNHKSTDVCIEALQGEKIHRKDKIPMYSFSPGFIQDIADNCERKNTWELTLNEGTIYLKIRDTDLRSELLTHHLISS